MEELTKPTFSKDAWILAISRLFERAGYYGFRSIFVLFMIDEIFDGNKLDSLSMYGWFTSLIYISYLLGGIIGDFILKSKKSILIGSLIQVVGIFSFCFIDKALFMPSLIVLIFGYGLYSPNALALFGKTNLKNSYSLPSAFSLFYLLVNVGSFLGVLLVGYLYYEFGRIAGFSSAGAFALLGGLIIFFIRKEADSIPKNTNFKQALAPIKVISVVILSAIFWLCYASFGGEAFLAIETINRQLDNQNLQYILSQINLFAMIPFAILLFFLWRKHALSYSIYFITAFLLAGLSIIILKTIPYEPNAEHVLTILIFSVLITLAEIILSPVVLSAITKYSNPRFLALIFGGYLLGITLITKSVNFMYQLYLGEENSMSSTVSAVILFTIGIILTVYFAIAKRKKIHKSQDLVND